MAFSLTAKLNQASGLAPAVAAAVRRFMFDMVGAVAGCENALNRLDALSSHGDFGARLNAVFQGLSDRMRYCDDDQLDGALAAFAESFKGIGGRAGEILSDWAGQIAVGLADVDPNEPLRPQIAELLYLTMESARCKWRLSVADKGFFTVLCPAIKALFAYASKPQDVAAQKVAAAAEAAFFQSRALRARVGHANYLGGRSVGQVDPGAYAAYMCVSAYCQRHILYDQPRFRAE